MLANQHPECHCRIHFQNLTLPPNRIGHTRSPTRSIRLSNEPEGKQSCRDPPSGATDLGDLPNQSVSIATKENIQIHIGCNTFDAFFYFFFTNPLDTGNAGYVENEIFFWNTLDTKEAGYVENRVRLWIVLHIPRCPIMSVIVLHSPPGETGGLQV